jgi:hypothetical protein
MPEEGLEPRHADHDLPPGCLNRQGGQFSTGADTDREWRAPLAEHRYAELRDSMFWLASERPGLASVARSWWPSAGPSWDAIAIARRRNCAGTVILVEANANVPEVGNAPCAAKSERSVKKITAAMGAGADRMARSLLPARELPRVDPLAPRSRNLTRCSGTSRPSCARARASRRAHPARAPPRVRRRLHAIAAATPLTVARRMRRHGAAHPARSPSPIDRYCAGILTEDRRAQRFGSVQRLIAVSRCLQVPQCGTLPYLRPVQQQRRSPVANVIPTAIRIDDLEIHRFDKNATDPIVLENKMWWACPPRQPVATVASDLV